MNKTASNVKEKVKKKAGQVKSENPEQGTIKDFVKSMYPAIKKALPSVITPERFTRIVLTALSKDPSLQLCTPASFGGAMMQAAQLGLEPNTPLGQAYLIPYRNHGTLECQFQLGYNGLITLAYRSGQIAKIDAQTVFENDEFEYELGWDAKLKHTPAMGDRGKPIGYYALFKTLNGGGNFLFMSQEDIDRHARKFSQAYRSGKSTPWQTDPEAMAKKTVIKQLLKYAPINVEFSRQVATDETVKNIDVGNADDVLYLPNEVEYEVFPVNDGETITESKKLEGDFVPFPDEEPAQESFTA